MADADARNRADDGVTCLLPGTRAGDYTIDAALEDGGFGIVYRAKHVSGRPAAVKVLHADLVATEGMLARFEREVHAIRLIRHAGVVDIYDVGRLPDGRPFYAMELLDGSDLQAHVEAVGRLAEADALAVLEPVCSALAAAHAHGIVHRDVKPSNVFLCRDGRVVLLDFGIAKMMEPEGAGLTNSRQRLGTPCFMAPEQAAGEPVDARSDVYALGVLAYYVLTGAPPYVHESPSIVRYLHRHARRQRPSTRADVSAAVDDVIVQAMRPAPCERQPDAAEFLAALRCAVADARGRPAAPNDVRDALAVHVDIGVDPVEACVPIDELLDEVDAIQTAATDYFLACGFTLAIEASRSLLFVHVEDTGGAAAAAAEFCGRLAARPSTSGVRARVAQHVGNVAFSDGRIVGGALLDLATWSGASGASGASGSSGSVEVDRWSRFTVRL